MISAVVLLLLQFLLPALVLTADVTSLQNLEDSLKSNPLNVEAIDDAFFPLNSPPSIAVDVSYFVNESVNGTATVPVHPLAMNSSARDLLAPNYTLQWVSHRSLLPFGNLHVLAPRILPLMISTVQTNPVVMLVIPPICTSSQQQSYVCSDIRIKKLLSRLTSKVSAISCYIPLQSHVWGE